MYKRDVLDDDPKRLVELALKSACSSRGPDEIAFVFEGKDSQWTATRNSTITLTDHEAITHIAVADRITVEISGLSDVTTGSRELASGDQLVFHSDLKD